jgi:amino acid adenylation domain-containing protein/thioester reductase-like protein
MMTERLIFILKDIAVSCGADGIHDEICGTPFNSTFVIRVMHYESYTLTKTQRRALSLAEIGSNRCVAYRLEGTVDPNQFVAAANAVMQRISVLSYRYLRVDGEYRIFQVDDHSSAISVRSTATWAIEDIHATIENICASPLRLDGGAPYRITLLHGTSTHYVVFACHSALIDQHSLFIVLNALARAYNGEEISQELGIPQADLLNFEHERVSSLLYDDNLRFWLKLAHDTSFEWKPARDESVIDGTQYFECQLSVDATSALADCAASLSMGLPELLTTAFHVFLGRLLRTDTVATIRNHRLYASRTQGVGYSEHRIFHKSVIEPGEPLRRILHRSKALYDRASYRADIPADDVFEELLRKDPAFTHVTKVLFDKSVLPFATSYSNGLHTTILPRHTVKLGVEDVSILFDHHDQLTFACMTRSAQDAAGVRQAMEQFLVMLQHLPNELDTPVEFLTVTTEEHRTRALALADGGPLPRAAEDVLVNFAASARANPTAPALRCGDRSLTYEEVALDVGSIAHHLQPIVKGVAEPLVGICLSRSEKMVEALYGVLAAGAGYLPLDPTMPAERLRFIASDSKLAAVLIDPTTAHVAEIMPEVPALDIDAILASPQPIPTPKPLTDVQSQTAYVIYTSGTTGKPKGVVLERGMLAHFDAMLHGQWDRGHGTRWMQFASINFDASILELFSPLVHGGELVVAQSEERTDPEAVFALLRNQRITHAFLPPAMLRLLPRRPLPDLQVVFAGGEAMDEETVRYWSKMVTLINIYGPTEATVFCNANHMQGYKASNQLGRPVPGYTTYILDDNEQLCPIGGIGEIVIGGPAVAREYLGREELTATKFRPNPYGPGRMYHTGDLGRFLPNGEVEFLGRMDFQVKIRGFRIELGDIESMIGEQPEVRGVFVGAFDIRGQKSLVAWYLSNTLAPDILRDRLAKKLPPYMVPSYLVPIDEFPVNVSGKVDRTRLPMPTGDVVQASERELDEMEQIIRDVWSRYLNIASEQIGPNSNFFHIGGHSLIAALVCNALSKQLGTDIRPKQLFEAPSLSAFALVVRGAPVSKSELPPLEPAGTSNAPLHNRLVDIIYSRSLHFAGDTTYNIVVRIDFSTDINPLHLRTALCDVLDANPIFRTAFESRDGHTWIMTQEAPPASVSFIDGTREQIELRAEALRSHVFDLGNAPLWTAEIICTPSDGSTILLNIHHAIFDGWSLNVFLDELTRRYQGESFPERITWTDYHAWSKHLVRSDSYRESIQYWQSKLKNLDAYTELPFDYRQRVPGSNASLPIRIHPTIVAALKAYADRHSVTLPPVLFALYLTWLWRVCGKQDLVCTYPYAGRDVPGSESIYGMFVSMGILTQSINPKGSLHDLIMSIHQQMLEDKEHLLASPHDADVSGLEKINVTFSLQNGIGLEGAIGAGSFKADELPSKTSKSDITGIFYQALDGGIEGRIEYDASLFRSDSIANFIDVFTTLVTSASGDATARVCDLSYMTDAQRNRVMSMAVGPHMDLPDQSITQRFAEMAATYPDNVAVIFEERRVTYRELDERSSAIASGLLQNVKPGDRVGLSLQKSDTLIAAMLGILKTGCAYVPLDSNYPVDRVQYFVANAAVQTVVCDDPSRAKLVEMDLGHLTFVDPVELQAEPHRQLPLVDPTTMAYIIHTSGSTGLPKGVMIEHHSVVRMVVGSSVPLEYDSTSIGTLGASMNFDASVLQIFSCLLMGGALVVISEEGMKDPVLMHATLRKEKVTHTMIAPVILQNMPREPLPSMKLLGYGGDVLEEQTAAYWSQQTRLFTLYGPTETTVMSSGGHIPPGANHRVIGKTLPGYTMYILNSLRQPVPEGAIGEICIGGKNMARGYLNRPDTTIERFISDPFSASTYALMYSSGDLGRFLPDGTIEFFGRNDSQIKLRGFRIELGEIESCLEKVPGILQVVCAVKGDGEAKYLAAYYRADQELDIESLRSHAGSFLPEYMVPTFFVRVDEIPASPSGKIDRKALPEVSGTASINPPHDGLERQIADIWEEILKFRGIDRDTSFFRVGGNSLLAVRMISELRKRLDLSVSITSFYASPTIEALARGHEVDSIELAVRDAQQQVIVANPADASTLTASPRSILLTGARGFLGIYLLRELTQRCDNVVCLLRSATEEDGYAQLRNSATEAGISIDLARVNIVCGDLAEPRLGLDETVFASLASDIDAVLHCGAFVHHLHSYQTMKAANVESTRTLLEFALTSKRKHFCFVSTESVASAISGISISKEEIIDNRPATDNGYILTKWTAEQIVASCAKEYGLPAVIARAGNITGDSATGYSNYQNNHFWMFTKGCWELGTYPDMPQMIEMTPVDVLARSIATLTLEAPSSLFVANLSNPNTITWGEFFTLLSSHGVSASEEDWRVWQSRLQTIDPSNGLSQIKDFYMGDLSHEAIPVEHGATVAYLRSKGVDVVGMYPRWVATYVAFLRQSGFFA